MCGSGNDGCGYFVANILYISEKLASCCAATAVVVCLVLTLIIMLALGVGLGYNYCVVDTKLLSAPPEALEGDESSTTTSTTTLAPQGRRKRDFNPPTRISQKRIVMKSKPETQMELSRLEDADIKPTMVVPLRDYDLQSLFTILRKNNRNVTLELVH